MSINEDELPIPFKQGLASIRELHAPDAKVVSIDGNFAFVALGEFQDHEHIYDQPRIELFARAALTFPDADPYGVATAPAVTRKDKATISNYHINHDQARTIQVFTGMQDIGYFSWDWKGMPRARAQDLAS